MTRTEHIGAGWSVTPGGTALHRSLRNCGIAGPKSGADRNAAWKRALKAGMCFIDQAWPNSAQIRPVSIEVSTTLAPASLTSGASDNFEGRPVLHNNGARSPKFGRLWPTHGRRHADSGRNRQRSRAKWAELGPSSVKLSEVARSRAEFGPTAGHIVKCWPSVANKLPKPPKCPKPKWGRILPNLAKRSSFTWERLADKPHCLTATAIALKGIFAFALAITLLPTLVASCVTLGFPEAWPQSFPAGFLPMLTVHLAKFGIALTFPLVVFAPTNPRDIHPLALGTARPPGLGVWTLGLAVARIHGPGASERVSAQCAEAQGFS